MRLPLANLCAGRIVPLRSRWPDMPDVPTMTEAGFPQIGTNNWQGLFAARGTPPEEPQPRIISVIVMRRPSALMVGLEGSQNSM
mgnify:CR=1 FL=1